MKDEIHVGKLIEDRLREEGRSVSWLSQRLYCDRSNIYRMFNNPMIDTQRLLKISSILNYDFFAIYSAFLQETKEKREHL